MDEAVSGDRVRAGQDPYLSTLEQLQQLRQFTGEPGRFWPLYIHHLVAAARAAGGFIAVREEKAQPPQWKVVALAPAGLNAQGAVGALLEQVEARLHDCLREGAARWEQQGNERVAVRLATGGEPDVCLAVFLLERDETAEAGPISAREVVRRLKLVSDIPAGYQLQRLAAESKTRVEHFARVLDLMVLINAEKRFLPAAMTFCNELASRHRCERVGLGWFSGGYVRLQALSRTENFDRKTEAVQLLGAVMEEALDQNTEVVWPEAQDGGAIRRDHQAYARSQDVAHLCSLPLRVEEEPVAVCTCERSAIPFSESELRLLRLCCDQAARRLADLKRSDRWFGARLAAGLRAAAGRLLGFEHTWLKVLAVVLAAALGFLLFGQLPYRVKAATALRTDDIAYLTAPFAGHIEKVQVRVGDPVQEGQELLGLDRTDLLLREAELIAEQSRYQGEVEKARASFAPADMRIAQALYDQAAARHELVRYQLGQSQVKAPFTAVVIEGDLIERIGSPVEQGDLLFRLARIERLYAELEVSEADVHELRGGQAGRVALASRPQESYAVVVERVEPVAVPREKGNVFIVRCRFEGRPLPWWRPGMTGMARLEAGRRRVLWILTHRTVDFLRLRLWW